MSQHKKKMSVVDFDQSRHRKFNADGVRYRITYFDRRASRRANRWTLATLGRLASQCPPKLFGPW